MSRAAELALRIAIEGFGNWCFGSCPNARVAIPGNASATTTTHLEAISLSRTFTIASSVAEASASSRRAQRPKPKGTDPILSRVPRREADTGENGDQHSGPVVEQSQNSY